ncbi:MAG: glycosyl transferase family 1, partial [Fibrobacter sp.]|nr:glycosyl transferase family 1 [Fibrobacter sp.]
DEQKWLDTLEECRKLKLEQEDVYLKMREASHQKSTKYTLENASKAQFDYFRKVYKKTYGK